MVVTQITVRSQWPMGRHHRPRFPDHPEECFFVIVAEIATGQNSRVMDVMVAVTGQAFAL